MTPRLRTGTLIAALVALLAFAPSAFAKGGDGGGSCAQILNFSLTPVLLDAGAGIDTEYTVQQGCVDERAASVSLVWHNDTTNTTVTSVIMTPLGTWSYSNVFHTTYSTRYTVTLNVYAPNGKLAATQKQTVTAPDAPAV